MEQTVHAMRKRGRYRKRNVFLDKGGKTLDDVKETQGGALGCDGGSNEAERCGVIVFSNG